MSDTFRFAPELFEHRNIALEVMESADINQFIEKLQRIGRLLGGIVERIFGVMGGLIWAFVGCIVAIHLFAVLNYPPMLLLTVCLLLPVGLGLWGLLKPAYVSLFAGPVLSAFPGDGFEVEKKREFFALFAALLSLIAGLLFQIHAVGGFGVTLFFAYAVLAPRIFRNTIAEPDAAREDGPTTK